MKAMIVFDVNDFTYEAIEDYFSGVITLHLGNDKFIDFQDVMLKPIPQKREAFEECMKLDLMTTGKVSEAIVWQVQGYNTCIDEILGDAE